MKKFVCFLFCAMALMSCKKNDPQYQDPTVSEIIDCFIDCNNQTKSKINEILAPSLSKTLKTDIPADVLSKDYPKYSWGITWGKDVPTTIKTGFLCVLSDPANAESPNYVTSYFYKENLADSRPEEAGGMCEQYSRLREKLAGYTVLPLSYELIVDGVPETCATISEIKNKAAKARKEGHSITGINVSDMILTTSQVLTIEYSTDAKTSEATTTYTMVVV